MTRFTKAVFVIFWLNHLSLAAAEVVSGGGSTLLHLDYHGFTIWLDCNRRGAVKFRYNTQRDQGDFGRLGTFSSIQMCLPAVSRPLRVLTSIPTL